MTSTSSSSGRRGRLSPGALRAHDFAVALRGVAPVALVALVAFAVLMPVSTAAVPDASIFNPDYTHDQMKWRFWNDSVLWGVWGGALLYGAALGLRAFKFLLAKSETTAFFSLPLTRLSLFGTRLAACFAALVAGIGLPLFASLAVNVAALGVWDGLYADCLYVLAGLLLGGLFSCAVAALSCALAGTLAEACAFSAALLAAVGVGAWGLNALMGSLLVGNAFGELYHSGATAVAPSLLEVTAHANPLLFFLDEASAHGVFIVQHPVYFPEPGNWGLLAAWLLACACAAALAAWLVARRPGERAGVAGQCLPMGIVCGLVVGLAAFGAAFTLMASVSRGAAIVAAFAAFLAVMGVAYAGPLRGKLPARRAVAALGAETAVLACVVAVVATGGAGYSAYVPDDADVASVTVSRTSAPDYLAVRFDTASAAAGAYYYAASYSYDDAESIAVATAAHRALAQLGHAELASSQVRFGDTVVLYDVKFDYELADGSHVVRYYDRADLATLSQLAQLDDSQVARDLARACVGGDVSGLSEDAVAELSRSSAHSAYATGEVYLSDALYASPVRLTFADTARAGLLAALAADAAAQDRCHPDAPARGVLMFTQAGDVDASSFAYSLSNSVVYLTDAYPRTLAWLRDNGLSSYLESPGAAAVEQVTLQRYDPYGGMNVPTAPMSSLFKGYRASNGSHFIVTQDFNPVFSTDDRDEVAAIVPLLRNQFFMDEPGYLACAKLAGVDVWSYFYLPDSAAPEWLLREAG